MTNYTISQNGEVKAELKNQESDINVIGKMHKIQGNSTHWALKYEGWSIVQEDVETGEKAEWKATGRFVINIIPIK